MDKDFLLYLKNIIELEKTAYVQGQTLNKLNGRINQLGRAKRIERYEVRQEASWVLNLLTSSVVAVPVGAVIFGIRGLVSDFISGAVSGIFTGALVGLVAAALIGAVKYAIDYSKENEKQQKYDERYAKEMAESV